MKEHDLEKIAHYAELAWMLFDGAVLQKDSIFKGRINIRSRTGELKGWMKKDLFLPNRINVYDRYGNIKGFLVKDILNPDTWLFRKGR
jgi:hypothetical protein